MTSRFAAGLVLALSVAGCAVGWKPITLDPQTSYKPRDEVQVWMHGQAQRWHGIRVDSNTVSGVPNTRPPECDSCRISVPRMAIDSVRVGDVTNAFVATVVGVLVIGGLGYFAFLKPGG